MICMKPKRKYFIALVLVAIVIILYCLIISKINYINPSEKVIKGGARDIVQIGSKDEFLLMRADNPVHINVGGGMLLSTEYVLRDTSSGDEILTNKSGITTYDLKTEVLEKSFINIENVLTKSGHNKNFEQIGNFYVYNGKAILEFVISNVKKENYYFEHIYFDVNDNVFLNQKSINKNELNNYQYFKDILDIQYMNLTPLTKSSYFKVDIDGRFVEIDLADLNKQNINLKQVINNLVTYKKDEKIYLFVQNELTSKEEVFQNIRHWLAPIGTDKLETFVTNPITGEKTVINSLDDYNHWKENHLELFEKGGVKDGN